MRLRTHHVASCAIGFAACVLCSCAEVRGVRKDHPLAPIEVDCTDAPALPDSSRLPDCLRSNWTWHRTFDAPDLTGLTWGRDGFFAVGQNSSTWTSTDGWHWRRGGRTHRIDDPYRLFDGYFGTCAAGDAYLAVAIRGGGLFRRGYDSIGKNMGVSVDMISVAWSGRRAIAVGKHGTIVTSDDLRRWSTVSDSATLRDLQHVSWTGKEFLATGNAGTLLRSRDGDDWVQIPAPCRGALTGFAANCLVKLLISDSGEILRSMDGLEWKPVYRSSRALRAVAWTGSSFVIVGDGGTILRSEDGVRWEKCRSGTRLDLTCLAVGTVIVAGGEKGGVVVSLDGVTWHVLPPVVLDWFSDVIRWREQFVAIGYMGAVFTSEDGGIWHSRSVLPNPGGSFRSIEAAGKLVVAVGAIAGPAGHKSNFRWVVRTSRDGRNWTEADIDITGQAAVAHWTGAEIYVGGQFGEVVVSPDGVSWVHESVGVNDSVVAIASRPGLVLAALESGRVALKRSGGNWVVGEAISGDVRACLDLIWDGSRFIALTGRGHLYASTNGLGWLPVGSEVPDGSRRLYRSQTGYYACGGRLLAFSRDLVHWDSATVGMEADVLAMASSRDVIVVVDHTGTLWSTSTSAQLP